MIHCTVNSCNNCKKSENKTKKDVVLETREWEKSILSNQARLPLEGKSQRLVMKEQVKQISERKILKLKVRSQRGARVPEVSQKPVWLEENKAAKKKRVIGGPELDHSRPLRSWEIIPH